MNNTELIKALRYCAEHEGCNYYIAKDCPRESTWVCGADCEQILMQDAADALEAAEKQIADFETALAAVENIKAVDAVPVVRCKECRWACLAPQRQTATCMKKRLPFTHEYDFYCADGERRTL